MEKAYYANSNQKRAGVAILLSNKIDFKLKKLKEAKKDQGKIDEQMTSQLAR